LLGLFFVLLEKESIRFFSTKFWILATALWLMVANITSYYRVWRNSKPALEEEDKHFRQERKSRRNRGGRRKRR
jgi:type VI protein secretion system component VasK